MAGPRRSDQLLVEAAKHGDREALEALLKRYVSTTRRYGLKLCRDREDAREVVQETMAAAVRTVAGFRSPASLPVWLYTIARSFCIKQHRHERSEGEPAASEAESVADTRPGPEENVARGEVVRVLESAITALPPDYREVLLRRDLEGATAPEVAQALGLTVAAVKSRLHRARQFVRARVAPATGSGEATRTSQVITMSYGSAGKALQGSCVALGTALGPPGLLQ